jgi:hypothetical protein
MMIRMSVVKVIGQSRHTFTLEGQNLWEVIMASQHLSFPDVKVCGKCNSDRLSMRAYETTEKKFQYVKIECGKCHAQVTFGKAQKDGAFFLRKDDQGLPLWEQMPSTHDDEEPRS